MPYKDPEAKRVNNRAYKIANKKSISEQGKIYYLSNKNRIKARVREYVLNNKDVILAKKRIASKAYRQKNKLKRTEYQREHKKVDVQFRLQVNLRARLNAVLKGKAKNGSSVRDLGCSVLFLKQYLESKFSKGMGWHNYGKNGWHIDHKIPLASFDLTNRDQLLEACHYTNLQPMWAFDNLSKGKRLLD